MKKNILILMTVFFLLTSAYIGFAEKLVTLTVAIKPNYIALDNQQFYIMEDTSVYIYSLQDFQLINKLGRRGKGPGEFLPYTYVIPQPQHLLINSFGKVSYFTKKGTLIKEIKIRDRTARIPFFPLQNGFVGRTLARENNVLYRSISLFNLNLEKEKEIYRVKTPLLEQGKIEPLKQNFSMCTYDNKIFISGKKGFIIDVLDHTGKQLFTISQNCKPQKFTQDDEYRIRKLYKFIYGQRYETLKHLLVFPDYYPEIREFIAADNRLYVVTYEKKNNNFACFIFDLEGKLLKRLFIPIVFDLSVWDYPFDIQKGKLYQLIENEDEEWELHATTIYEYNK